jgi:GDPmannose 4,6-dehydratase
MKKALITGINGQDGSYLAELLLEKGFVVAGLVRRSSVAENQTYRLNSMLSHIQTFYADLSDLSSIERVLAQFKPTHLFNLAAQSHVRISFDIPAFTAQANAIGALNVYQAVRNICPDCRVYQASSSEMFGDSVDTDMYQRETTRMTPVSPYGAAKLYAYNMARNYRKAYSMFISNGILFNHESPRRGSNFVTSKVVQQAVRIKLGKADKLVLGNLDSYRDWGHSKDYVKAMFLIISHQEPDDFVIATGETHSVRDLCKLTFELLDLDYENYVVQDEQFTRPEELPYLKGDSSKARKVLGWRPEYSYESLIIEMVNYFLELYSNQSKSS